MQKEWMTLSSDELLDLINKQEIPITQEEVIEILSFYGWRAKHVKKTSLPVLEIDCTRVKCSSCKKQIPRFEYVARKRICIPCGIQLKAKQKKKGKKV